MPERKIMQRRVIWNFFNTRAAEKKEKHKRERCDFHQVNFFLLLLTSTTATENESEIRQFIFGVCVCVREDRILIYK